jgi:hypothetical protein
MTKPASRWPFLIFLTPYLAFCLLTFRDYGVTWDEFDAYIGGGQWLKHYLGQGVDLLEPEWNYSAHNYIYTALLRPFTLSKTILPDRLHLLNMLFAGILFWLFFELLRLHYKDWRWALLGPFALFLTPGFLGHIPANPKDMPLAILYFMGLAAMIFRREGFNRPWIQNLFLGSLFGLVMSQRIAGFTLLPLYVVFRVYEDWVIEKTLNGRNWKEWVKAESPGFLSVIAISQIVLAVSWPFIGKSYFSHLLKALGAAHEFAWTGKILFNGVLIEVDKDRPWYYLPVWIFITMPIFLMVPFLYALAKFKSFWTNKIYVLMLLAFGCNMALYFLLQPVIYGGLRHFLFLLPLITFLACLGLVDFYRNQRNRLTRWMVGVLLVFNMGTVTVHLIRLHPYEYLYFNELVGGTPGANGKYEMDYWGESLRAATLWLKENELQDPNKIYKIKLAGNAWQENTYLPSNVVTDLEMDPHKADYCFALNGCDVASLPSGGEVIHVVEREGVPLSYVVKMQSKGN